MEGQVHCRQQSLLSLLVSTTRDLAVRLPGRVIAAAIFLPL
jgi:hypothetical protein